MTESEQPTVSQEELETAQQAALLEAEAERARLATAETNSPPGAFVAPEAEAPFNGGEPTRRRRGFVAPEDRPWEEDDPEKVFRIRTWSGIPNYECRECDFATTKGARFAIEHYYHRHAPPEEIATRPLIFGPTGRAL